MTLYGPMIVGHLHGEAKRDARHRLDLSNLRSELAQANAKALGAQAIADASVALANTLVVELEKEAAGKLPERRFSDPKAASARNKGFIDAAQARLERLAKDAGKQAHFSRLGVSGVESHDGEPATAVMPSVWSSPK